MRFAIAIAFTSIVTLAGCSPCLDAFKLVEVGKPLPDKLPAGLYRTGIGFGRAESGLSPIPFGPCSRRLQVLTDDKDLTVTCENPGTRRIRLEVVRRERSNLKPLEDFIGDVIVNTPAAILMCLARP